MIKRLILLSAFSAIIQSACVASFRPSNIESRTHPLHADSVSVGSSRISRIATNTQNQYYYYNYSLTAYQNRTPNVGIGTMKAD